MVPGFNTSVVHDGTEYHVQTEDLGDKHPYILTLVYRGGAIVSREKVDYREALGAQASPAQIKTFMEDQHQRTMRCIAGGGLSSSPMSPPSPPAAAAPSAPPKSVDELIAEYLQRRNRRVVG
jgi:hypothetical protein